MINLRLLSAVKLGDAMQKMIRFGAKCLWATYIAVALPYGAADPERQDLSLSLLSGQSVNGPNIERVHSADPVIVSTLSSDDTIDDSTRSALHRLHQSEHRTCPIRWADVDRLPDPIALLPMTGKWIKGHGYLTDDLNMLKRICLLHYCTNRNDLDL